MKSFKYETHLHTIEGSACAVSKAVDYIEVYKRIGYSGIFVTNHFFGGNTCVPQNLPWKERIEMYCRGYELAFEACKNDCDFKVFFGIEQTFDGDDYLIFGFDKNWLLSHPEIEFMNHQEVFAAVNEVNGLMIQAHPFRLRNYIQAVHLHPREVHAVEIYNGGNKAEENELAALYAKNFHFPCTSGTDIHNANLVLENPGIIGGVEFDSPLEDVFDFAARVKSKNVRIVKN